MSLPQETENCRVVARLSSSVLAILPSEEPSSRRSSGNVNGSPTGDNRTSLVTASGSSKVYCKAIIAPAWCIGMEICAEAAHPPKEWPISRTRFKLTFFRHPSMALV